MMKPLSKCCNGCDASPQPPSFVLCEKCLNALDVKMRSLYENIIAKGERERRAGVKP